MQIQSWHSPISSEIQRKVSGAMAAQGSAETKVARTFSGLLSLCTLLASFPQVTLSHWERGQQQLQGNPRK